MGDVKVIPALYSVKRATLGLLLLSLIYHIIFLNSIFDIYFQSPVVTVPVRYSTGERLAKRVVLIVGDGLRADKLFQLYDDPPFERQDPLPQPLDPSLPHHKVEDSEPDAEVDLVDALGRERDARGIRQESPRRTKTTPAPFLRSLIDSGQAQFGISHTRVPTESRPGHVALLGGMYEDVSAVTRGWTTNPVSFDSVLNQSTNGFTFGSPDILPMFGNKAGARQVREWSYDEEEEDFTKDAVWLDLWVLAQLETLFNNATTTEVGTKSGGRDGEEEAGALRRALEQDGNVFFLHLLGLDTTGHSYRPHGPEYHRNIRVVDYVVRRTVELFDEFYRGDGETAFIFTADHGMSSLGNHGDGHPDNTRTPLVVWGKGVRTRDDRWEEPANHDEYSKDWRLKGVRRDVEQADVAPLIATLAGLAIPANSAGRTPMEYLDADPSFRARAAFANANQLLAEAEAKSQLKRQHTLSFQPFPDLVDSVSAGTLSPETHRAVIDGLIREGKYLEAEKHCNHLMDVALHASTYFQKYDWFLLRSIATLGYLGFMLYVTRFILLHHVLPCMPESYGSRAPPLFRVISKVPLIAFAFTATRFFLEKAPVTYTLYTFFAFYFWHTVLSDCLAPFFAIYRSTVNSTSAVSSQPNEQRELDEKAPLKAVTYGTMAILALTCIAYGYTDRRALSILAVGMGWGWPRSDRLAIKRSSEAFKLLWSWRVTMTLLAIFPMLPVEKGENIGLISVGALLVEWLAIVAMGQVRGKYSQTRASRRAFRFINAEFCFVVLSQAVTCTSIHSLRAKEGLPRFNQYLGWIVLSASALVPFIHGRPLGQPPLDRLLILFLSFGPAFVILSLSYETIFYCVLCCALLSWMGMESLPVQQDVPKKNEEVVEEVKEASPQHEGGITLDTIRVSVFFLSFVHLGFFGVGNVASISSFYLEPVYRLMTVFAPFPMGALLLYKLLIPFVALSAVASAINRKLRLPHLGLFLVSSVLVELLTINFFFRVTDVGSWLEIGSSITNFVICSLLGLFTSGLLLIGEAVLKGTSG